MDADRYEKARELQHAGSLAAAAALYEQVVAEDPAHFRAWNNLGVCHEQLGQADAAESCFRRALAVEPDAAPVLHNLGRLLHQQDRFADAEPLYRRALAIAPGMSEAHFNLGRLLQESGRPADAESTLREAARLEPDSASAQSYLGDLLFEQKRPAEALEAYQRAAALEPDYPVAHFDMGKALETLKREDEAVECYRRACALDPEGDAPREALVRALESAGRHDEAIAELHAWLAASPAHPLATHLLASLGGAAAPERASDAYVRGTFDRFAADFDQTLERLGYRAPQLIEQAIVRNLGERSALEVLDAGCGTGLCAPFLRPRARTLDGVDLSGEMLARARRRGGYDALHEAELSAYLAACDAAYDLIASADTFCYFGELGPLCANAARALRPGGWLVFTVEHLRGEGGFELHAAGRYAHAQDYVREALAAAGFVGIELSPADLRNEGGIPVHGLVVSARRD